MILIVDKFISIKLFAIFVIKSSGSDLSGRLAPLQHIQPDMKRTLYTEKVELPNVRYIKMQKF